MIEFFGSILEWICAYYLILFVYARYSIYELGIVILCGLIAFIAVIVICHSISRKREKLIRVAAVIIGLCPTIVMMWYLIFPTAYPYVDLWILGKTEEEIIEVYGEPRFEPEESDRGNKMAYYTRTIFLDPEYYMIIFEDGVAVDMKEGLFPYKGG